MKVKRGLGRGLDALIPGAGGFGTSVLNVPIDQIHSDPDQPRKSFGDDGLNELSDSLRQHGVLQPLLVRQQANGYALIAGERRLRAARLAGLERVPVLVRDHGDSQERLVLALVENLQREDLNALEQARALHRLAEEFALTHEEVARLVGWSRAAVSNSLRLLGATPALQSALIEGLVSAGLARALLAAEDPALQELGLRRALEQGWSVRQAEAWAGGLRHSGTVAEGGREVTPSAQLAEWAAGLEEALGLGVHISGGPSRGRLTISYRSRSDLERLRRMLASPEGDSSQDLNLG